MPYKFNPFTGKFDNAPGAPVFSDAKFTIFDDGDKTKKFQFEASAISAATTRTLDIQDVDGPVAIGYGTANQYIRGDATISNFPVAAGGGSSVSYYLNGSVSQGTILGDQYYEINKIPAGASQTDFALTTGADTAFFITDVNDPSLLQIPQGNFTFQLYCQTSAGSPQVSVELYKYDGAAFTQIGTTSQATTISNTAPDIHFLTVAVPASTTLALTDRLAVRVIGSSLGANTLTLNTEGNTQSQIITTFSTGLAALNGLTDQVQFFATGTTGTNFNIVSSGSTHTFNIPVASAANTGKLSATDWSTFNAKIGAGLYTATTGLTMNTATMLGRTTAGVGAAEEITVGTGLSLAAGVLSNSGVGTVTATAPITSSGGANPDISTSMNTDRLIGRTTAGTGVMEEIAVAGALTLSAGTLTGTGVVGSVGAVDNAVLRADVGTGVVQNSSIIIDDETTATQNNVAIVNNDSQADSALVLTPKGTGAFILGPKPDGTAVGGNARGARAIDLQTNRTAATQVASGSDSFAAGLSNTASGSNSTAIGRQCAASGSYSTAIGRQCTASGSNATAIGYLTQATNNSSFALGYVSKSDRYGMVAESGIYFSAGGDAQRGRFVLANKTTNDTATELFLEANNRLTIPSGKVLALTINISGIKSDGSAVAHYLRQYALKNVAGTTSEVYAPVTIGTDNAAGTSIALSANDTNDALKVEVTGIAAETWRWVASVDAVEIAYGT